MKFLTKLKAVAYLIVFCVVAVTIGYVAILLALPILVGVSSFIAYQVYKLRGNKS